MKKRQKKAPEVSGQKKIRFGVKAKIIAGILIPLIVVLVATSELLNMKIISIMDDLKQEDISAQTGAAAQAVGAYFEPYFISAGILGDVDGIQELVKEVEAESPSFNFKNSLEYSKVLAELKDAEKNLGVGLKSVWMGTVKNSQVMQSDGYVTDSGFVLAERP